MSLLATELSSFITVDTTVKSKKSSAESFLPDMTSWLLLLHAVLTGFL